MWLIQGHLKILCRLGYYAAFRELWMHFCKLEQLGRLHTYGCSAALLFGRTEHERGQLSTVDDS